jgi:hypothetical protein
MRFDGSDYAPASDDGRLSGQYVRIFVVMRDAQWRTLAEVEASTGAPQSSISAQLRHMRKARFGSHTVEKRLRGDSAATYEYRLLVNHAAQEHEQP